MTEPQDKFWSLVEKTSDCWLWQGKFDPITQRPYFDFNHRRYFAHKLAWELVNDPLPHKKKIARTCENPRCVNPSHLYALLSPDSFWMRVDKTSSQSGCWLWKGSTDKRGYGVHVVGTAIVKTHRYSWELTHGKIENNLSVLHHCDVRHCVNPSHLYLGTQAENVRDMWERGRAADFHGQSSKNAKLTNEEILEIRSLASQGFTQKELAKRFNVGRTTIQKIVNRQTWDHI